MLRITRHPDDGGTLLRLEGVLREGWLDEVSAQVALAQHAASSPLKLDLTDITFVDAAGAALLRELIDKRAQIVGCSGFVAASLGLETP
jgi:ABC-type transporter Mla MlaB component